MRFIEFLGQEHLAKFYGQHGRLTPLKSLRLESTASEPLTLEEEYQMQQNWQLDSDKLTFIIVARPHLLADGSSTTSDEAPSPEQITTF
ncbi:hypothetical protein M422DRAFT_265044 [Sphaerobolus stellatus SS14]|uniref:Uncharacterized protein n=1 Tax=Sphaerobolus stellatus (strain SS14) TaxID=990650 RepID=A0A0C9V6B4_SPHS4|nr:hypothetical protein M422DRAFT_265044 [Sphaerobolus stellatus SS14]